MSRFLPLNSPDLNRLGSREPAVCGATSRDNVDSHCAKVDRKLGHKLEFFPSDAEHNLIDRVQKAAADGVDFIIPNPRAFTHMSIALRDAFLAVRKPFFVLDLSNTFARQEFRHNSYFSDIASSCLFGFGAYGSALAF